ncbi:MAG: HlyD family type I secretion periplasmic adaptor subunit [Methylococcaceae bacterium]|nr:MAG: HlyD family type I secretion periplasmic adaptor subunit [Methylococcaceae bacterium]
MMRRFLQWPPGVALTRSYRWLAAVPYTHRLLAYSTLLMGLLCVWAITAPLDVVSNAVGEVLPVTRLKAVQHLEGGMVAEILVEEGRIVELDQPLVLLDPLRATSEFDELSSRIVNLRIDIIRLQAEAEWLDAPRFPEELEQQAPHLVAESREIFNNRRSRINHDIQEQENLITQRQQELKETQTRLQSHRKTLAMLAEQVHISETMLQRELTNRMMHLDLARQWETVRGQIDTDQAALPRIEAAHQEAREHLASMREGFIEKARAEMTEAQRSFDELSQRALKYKQARERTVLRSPVKGIVKTLAVAARGEVVQPGQTVVEIVPMEDRLVIEAKLPLQDIGYVHEGQKVRVTLNTPDAARFGHIEGVVRTVSPDAIVTEEKNAFYKVRIETEKNQFSAKDHVYRLYPGMQVLCSIRTGMRTVAEYLLGPWLDSLRFALEER